MDSDSSLELLCENLLPNRPASPAREAQRVAKAQAVVGRLSRAVSSNAPFDDERFSVHTSPTSSSLCSDAHDASVASRMERPEEIARRRMRKAIARFNGQIESLHAEIARLEGRKKSLQSQVERLQSVDRREAQLGSELRLLEQREAGIKVKERALEEKLQLAERSKEELVKFWESQSALEAREATLEDRERQLQKREKDVEVNEAKTAEALRKAEEVNQKHEKTLRLEADIVLRENRIAERENKVEEMTIRLQDVEKREVALQQAKVDLEEIEREKAKMEELKMKLEKDKQAAALLESALEAKEKKVSERLAQAEQLKSSLESAIAETEEKSLSNERTKEALLERSTAIELTRSEVLRQRAALDQDSQHFEREMKYRREQWESTREREREELERLRLEALHAQEKTESANRKLAARENRLVAREKEVQSFKCDQVALREEEFKLNASRAELTKKEERLRDESTRLEAAKSNLESIRAAATEAQAALERKQQELRKSRSESLDRRSAELEGRAAELDKREDVVKSNEQEISQAKQARLTIKKLKKACEKEIRRSKEASAKSQEAEKAALELQRDLTSREKAVKEREIRLQAYEQRMEDLESKENNLSSLQLQLERASIKVREKEKQIQQKEHLLDQQKEQLEGIEADRKSEWKRHLATMTQSVQASADDKEELKRRWSEVEHKESEVAAAVEEQRKLRAKLVAERAQVETALNTVNLEKDEVNRQKLALSRREAEFVEQVREWQSEQAALQKEAQEVMQVVNSERADLENFKAKLQRDKTGEEAENRSKAAAATEELRRLEEEVSRLQAKKHLAINELDKLKRNTATAAAEAKQKEYQVLQAEKNLEKAAQNLRSLGTKQQHDSPQWTLLKERKEKLREYEKEFESRAREKAQTLNKRQARVRAMENKVHAAAEAVRARAKRLAKREKEIETVKERLETCLSAQQKKQRLEIKLRVPNHALEGATSKNELDRPGNGEPSCKPVEKKEEKEGVETLEKTETHAHEQLLELFEEMNLAQQEEFMKLHRRLEAGQNGDRFEKEVQALIESMVEARALAEQGMMNSATELRADILDKLKEIEHNNEAKYETMERKWEHALEEIKRQSKPQPMTDSVTQPSLNPSKDDRRLSSTASPNKSDESPRVLSQSEEAVHRNNAASQANFASSHVKDGVRNPDEEHGEFAKAKKGSEPSVQEDVQDKPEPELNHIEAPIEQLQTVTPLLAQRAKEARERLATAIVAEENVSFSKIDSILKAPIAENASEELQEEEKPEVKTSVSTKEEAVEDTAEKDTNVTQPNDAKEAEADLKQKLTEERELFEAQMSQLHSLSSRLESLRGALESVKARISRLAKILPRKDAGVAMQQLTKAWQETDAEFCKVSFTIREAGDLLRNSLKPLDAEFLTRTAVHVELTEKMHLHLEETLQVQILRGHAIVETRASTPPVEPHTKEETVRRGESVSIEVLAAENQIACSLQTLEDTIRARDRILERGKDDELSTLTDTEASGQYDCATSTGMPRISEEDEKDVSGAQDKEVEHELDGSEVSQSDGSQSEGSLEIVQDSEIVEDANDQDSFNPDSSRFRPDDEASFTVTQRSESAERHTDSSFEICESQPVEDHQLQLTSVAAPANGSHGTEVEMDSERARKILRLQEISVELALASDEEEARLLQKEFDALQESLGGEPATADDG